MATVLQQGGNTSITGTGASRVLVALDWQPKGAPGMDVDASAFLLAGSGKVRSDADMVFYNQPRSPEGGVAFDTPGSLGLADAQAFTIDFSAMPGGIEKVAFCVTIHEAQARGSAHMPSRPSAVEHRPADLVAQPLIVEDEIAYRVRELCALPFTLETAGFFSLTCWRRCTRGFDGVGRRAQLVCRDMGHRGRLAGSKCRVAGGAAQIARRSHGMAARRARLRHGDLAARPGACRVDSAPRPVVIGLHFLEEVQHLLRAVSCPLREQVMVVVCQCSPAPLSDEPGVALLWQYHPLVPARSFCLTVACFYDVDFCSACSISWTRW